MRVIICDSEQECGRQAAQQGEQLIREAIGARGAANIILATGISQLNMLASLVKAPEIDWSLVTGFHLDEYIGLPREHPASFCRYLKERFVDLVPIRKFHYIDAQNSLTEEIERQNQAISRYAIDVAFVGIGENGHLAFNDPPADFMTEEPYLIVNLDRDCRQQQLNEGWFPNLDEVPLRAISMSISQIMKAAAIVATVPGSRKAAAVRNCLAGPVTPDAPGSILQNHERATIYLDLASSSLLPPPCPSE